MVARLNLETVTHVAGPQVMVGHRVIQRCSICGEKLADTEDPNLATFWNEASLVRNDGGEMQEIGDFLAKKVRLPRDFCLMLVETWPPKT